MVSAVNVGSINMPKMLRHMRHRSSQVRDLTFVRDDIKQKDVKTTKVGGSNISGPAVSFGYEKSSSAAATEGTDTAYHAASPEIVLPGLTMLQSPIVSRRGRLENTGHRISGACSFYAPSADYIQNLDNFGETVEFGELESYDKLYDIEKIIHKVDSFTGTSATSHTIKTFADGAAGYQVDRLQFKIKSSGTLTNITLNGNDGGNRQLRWTGTLALPSTDYITIDVPLRDIKIYNQNGHTGASDKTSIYKDGVREAFTAETSLGVDTMLDLDKLYGDSSNELSSLIISLQSSASVELKDIYLYKEAEWRIESIKDYRDEYMKINAVRVRGDRASRRRAYG
jgi:hypothetical protein